MPAHIRAEPTYVGRPATTPLRRRFRMLAAAVLALLAQGCTAPPHSPFGGPDPSDPRTRAPATAYRSTIGSYEKQRPVEPARWRERNERAAPAPNQ